MMDNIIKSNVNEGIITLYRKDNTIKSIELVDVINVFRKAEGKTELLHKNFMEKIRKEMGTLYALGIDGGLNFKPDYYTDLYGREQPCFELTKHGMMEMLNSESVFVRFKTVEYIDSLEKKNNILSNKKEKLYSILITKKEYKQRQFETNNKLYSFSNINKTLKHCTVDNLKDTTNSFIKFHYGLKRNQRDDEYKDLVKDEYKKVVLKTLYKKLDKADYNNAELNVLKSNICVKIQQDILNITKKELSKSNKRVKEYEQYIEQACNYIEYIKPSMDKFVECNTAPITNNNMYKAASDYYTGKPVMVKTTSYNKWLELFDTSSLDKFKNLDFSKPVYVHAKYVMSSKQDVSNFIKPLFDKIASYYGVDDRLFYVGTQEVLSYYDNVKEGRIYLYLCN